MVSNREAPAGRQQYPLVSIIIPYFNARETIRLTVESLLQSGYPGLEIICVDDRSDDGTQETISDFPVAHVCMVRRSGAAVARNTGASRASGEILFFIDADVAAMPDTIFKMAETFTTDPSVDACFGEYTALPITGNFATTYKNLVHHYTHQSSRPEAHTFWCGCGAIRAEV